MSSTSKRLLAAALCVVMMLGLFIPAGAAEAQATLSAAGSISRSGGSLETAYVEWAPAAGVSKYEVYVKEAGAASYPTKPIDDKLIRQYPGYMRADVLGLKAGSYTIKVSADDGTSMETGAIQVLAHDRSGFAFSKSSKYKTASGAYNDDGTLKSNAIVLYVDNSNFDSIQLTVKDSKGKDQTFTGVQQIVDANLWKADPNAVLCIRVLGTIDTTGFPTGSWGSSSEGLQIKGASGYTQMNLTLEGVGKDAAFKGFGVLLRNCGNVEVRNLGVINCKDDAISVDTDNCNLWVHNVDFFYGQKGSASDQKKGDGSLDTKDSVYVTHSYNHFWDSGKCNLQGGTKGDGSDFITYHHNWYDHSDSRHPRVRVASVHVYNNYYDNNDKYGIAASHNSSVFSENNYFLNCPKPMLQSHQGTDAAGGSSSFGNDVGGLMKAYGNTIVGSNSKFVPYTSNNSSFDAYDVTDRSAQVPSTITGADGGTTYNNFDTDPSFYTYTAAPADTALVNHITTYAGRVQGGDITFTFTEQDSKAGVGNDKVWPGDGSPNPTFKAQLDSYKPSLLKIGGTVSGSASSGNVAVTGVAITPVSALLKPEETIQLTAELEPSTATNQNVTWASNNTAAATVSNTGLVTAVANGVAEITVTTADGNKTATCTVTVSDGSGAVIPGPSSSGNSKTLKHDQFVMNGDNLTTDGKKSAFVDNEVEDATDGYFHVIGNVMKRNGNGGTSGIAGTKAEFFELPKSNTSGFSFTVADVPATVSVAWGSPKSDDSQKVTVAIVKDGTALLSETKGGKSNTSTLELKEAGTYLVTSAADASYSARVFSVSVTESGTTTQPSTSPSPSTQPSTTPSTQPSTQPSAAPVAVSGVKLNTSAVTLRMDGTKTATLTATVSPSNAANKSVTWTSSNTAVATVANGVVTAVSAGTATITAKTADGNKTATCTVTVKAAAGGTSTGADYTLVIDDVVAAVKANSPEGWTATDITGGAAPLTGQGTSGFFAIYPKGAGGSSGSKFDKGKEFTDTYKPTSSLNFGGNAGLGETKDSPVNSVMFTTTGAADVKVWWIGGGSGTRKMVVLDANGDVTATSAESASDSTAYISTLAVTEAGTYYLGPTGGSNKICKVVVTVKSGGTAEPADKPVTGVTLDKTTLALATDGTKTGQLTATVAPADADEKTVSWSSSDEAVATVDQTGKVTAVGAGTATITVTTADGGFTKTCAVTVTAPSAPPSQNPSQSPSASTKPSSTPSTKPSESTPPSTAPVAVTGVTLNRSAATVTAGKTLALTATVQPTNATNKGVYWTSGDTKILTVSNTGVVTGVAAGKATVTVTTLDGGFTATCDVTVNAASSGGSSSSGGGGGGGGSTGGGGGSAGGGTTTTTPTTTMPFVDVPDNVWYVDSVRTIYALGLMKGTDDTHFAPGATTTRAMVATVLYRLDGEKDANVAALFGDVVSGSWYEKAVKWAAEKGVVKGYSEDVFAPDDNVTREQLAVMLYRYANGETATVDLSAKFTDAASVSDWAADAIAWAVDKGILNGKGDGTLDPQGLATRAEICAMLVRFVALNK